MVLNLCLPHFQTSIQCNKLSADGHDVSNLLSGDPDLRRRGFKLEYFLRPPVHVTLRFQAEMELCRLDLELWPWGADQGRRSRRMEILVCSERDGESFRLVSRCDLQEELQVCVVHPAFRPRAPFRGSLASVAQLRISIPYSGAASALGIKALAVWASPTRCCSASQLQTIQEAHLNALKPNPITSAPAKTSHPVPTHSKIPEEFLDPLTQELMVFPMILPSGMIIDLSTLEEYQKREATWGRVPNDPFTGVPFTPGSKPLPNPLLKTRIDRLLLQTGSTGVGKNLTTIPQPSRLTLEEAKDDTERSRIQSGSVPDSGRDSNNIYDSTDCSRIQSGSIPGFGSNCNNMEASQQHSRIQSRSISGSGRDSNNIDNSTESSRIQSGSIPGSDRDSNNIYDSTECSRIQSESIPDSGRDSNNIDDSTQRSRIQSRSIPGFGRNCNNMEASQQHSRIQSGSVKGSNKNSNNINVLPQHSRIQSGSIPGSSRNCININAVPQRSKIQSNSDSDSKSGATQSRSSKRKYDSSFPSTSADPDRSPRKTHETPPDSHERRLADSLDEALNAALHGLPTFTSQRQSEDESAGQHTCVFCSCSLTVYSSSVASYSLPCSHLTCGPCLRGKHASESHTLKIKCPVCGSSASSRDVTRVHH